MSLNYQELDFQQTPLGGLMLRRRRMPQFNDTDIYEIKLGESFLMSSLFYKAEHELSQLGLKKCVGESLNLVVGGLGLGYTALSALKDPRVKKLFVIEYLKPVIDWHKSGLLPMAQTLITDPRCEIIEADFFKRASQKNVSFNEDQNLHDGIFLDIDHKPDFLLHPNHSDFYSQKGLETLSTKLKSGGVFGLWADGKPDENFNDHLKKVFKESTAHTIDFLNPFTNGLSFGTVYIAVKA